MPAKTALASDKIDVPAACAVPFRPYCGGVVTRTQNVIEYMLVLALCGVCICIDKYIDNLKCQMMPNFSSEFFSCDNDMADDAWEQKLTV